MRLKMKGIFLVMPDARRKQFSKQLSRDLTIELRDRRWHTHVM
jgi:hypothetical protein